MTTLYNSGSTDDRTSPIATIATSGYIALVNESNAGPNRDRHPDLHPDCHTRANLAVWAARRGRKVLDQKFWRYYCNPA